MTTKASPGPLAEAVRRRRLELGLRQGDLAARGGPALATVGLIESGKERNPRPLTLGGLDRALGWPAGTAQGVVDGRPAPEAELEVIEVPEIAPEAVILTEAIRDMTPEKRAAYLALALELSKAYLPSEGSEPA